MIEGTGCALCGKSAISRRIDLTDSDVSAKDITDYEVRGVLRGVLLCAQCIIERPVGQLLNVSGGVEIVRGCMVQCAGQAPWHLRHVLPGGVRVWRKTQCPCCHGRATVQIIADAFDRPTGVVREGFRQAFALLSLRRDADEDAGESWPDPEKRTEESELES